VSKLAWRPLDRRALADLLDIARAIDSSAVGATTVYRLETEHGEVLALALPDGEALVVELAAPTPKRRRRPERKDLSPASR